jgi:hypothetical protein
VRRRIAVLCKCVTRMLYITYVGFGNMYVSNKMKRKRKRK